MSLKERIDVSLSNSGINASELARKAGVTRAAVSLWRNGTTRTLAGDNLIRVAQILKVNPYWLATGEGTSAPIDSLDNPSSQAVPLLSWAQLVTWHDRSMVPMSQQYMPCPVEHGSKTFALQAQDNSMTNPGPISFNMNEYLFVDPAHQPVPGHFVVVITDEGPALRQLRTEGGQKVLVALNPGMAGNRQVLSSEQAILGVAIFHGAKLV